MRRWIAFVVISILPRSRRCGSLVGGRKSGRRMFTAMNKMGLLVMLGGMLAAGVAPAQTNAAEGWTAKWIQAPWSTERDGAELDGSRPMPVFRREFTARAKPVKATLRIAGLGQYEVLVDGGRVSPVGLHQAWTDYKKTVTYDSYDVTEADQAGRMRWV